MERWSKKGITFLPVTDRDLALCTGFWKRCQHAQKHERAQMEMIQFLCFQLHGLLGRVKKKKVKVKFVDCAPQIGVRISLPTPYTSSFLLYRHSPKAI